MSARRCGRSRRWPWMCRAVSKPRPGSRITRKCSASSRPSAMPTRTDYAAVPDALGHFGPYGGRFVAETLMEPLRQLDEAYRRLKNDPAFQAELDRDLKHYVGRPS